MNTAFHPSTTTQRPAEAGIAWEALPSLSHLVGHQRQRRDVPTWEDTRPVEFDSLGGIEPFREALEGLAVREVHEPEIFNALFGDARRA